MLPIDVLKLILKLEYNLSATCKELYEYTRNEYNDSFVMIVPPGGRWFFNKIWWDDETLTTNSKINKNTTILLKRNGEKLFKIQYGYTSPGVDVYSLRSEMICTGKVCCCDVKNPKCRTIKCTIDHFIITDNMQITVYARICMKCKKIYTIYTNSIACVNYYCDKLNKQFNYNKEMQVNMMAQMILELQPLTRDALVDKFVITKYITTDWVEKNNPGKYEDNLDDYYIRYKNKFVEILSERDFSSIVLKYYKRENSWRIEQDGYNKYRKTNKWIDDNYPGNITYTNYYDLYVSENPDGFGYTTFSQIMNFKGFKLTNSWFVK